MEKLNQSYKIIWIVFKINRMASGSYSYHIDLDKEWIDKQSKRLGELNSKVTFVVADQFIKDIYRTSLSEKEKLQFIKNIYSAIGSKPNFNQVVFESELIEKYWNIEDFKIEVKSAMTIKREDDVIQIEIKKRKTMYNDNCFKIDDAEALDIAKSALAYFDIEEELLQRLKF